MPFRLLKVKPFPKVDFRARISTQYSHSQIPFLPSVPSSIACCFYWKECRNSRGNICLGVNTGHVIEIMHFLYFPEYSSAWSWCLGGTRCAVCRECRQVFRPGWERCDWHDKEGNSISLSWSPAPSPLLPPPLACGLTFQPTESLRKEEKEELLSRGEAGPVSKAWAWMFSGRNARSQSFILLWGWWYFTLEFSSLQLDICYSYSFTFPSLFLVFLFIPWAILSSLMALNTIHMLLIPKCTFPVQTSP